MELIHKVAGTENSIWDGGAMFKKQSLKWKCTNTGNEHYLIILFIMYLDWTYLIILLQSLLLCNYVIIN